ncbi:nitroreductase family deazaflavin-dependent oxidoreductase [Phytoactinopolyspora alkaliphila]|uniref:Nitroreductase family deazaflavin-dependent oxidoreductase n=1 Tax=Phytoactinopolyspora alkaliphila TaxID=1783498 RepID=A0A6N9YRZ9_9ACTN|nr:nitroreductase family deazaflavin-dependent oxidoreductase [Phytoactinopolyspora alkaliphila]NED97754.1 nitroreductase family deazaflavin-dependent oxidoreductase [Phytoactinopolyspora alkaliphila]
MSDDKSFNEQIIKEFRANAGSVGGDFEGTPMVLVTTTGVKTGLPRTSPLVYTRDGDRLVVIASNGGADKHPSWYTNLRANPIVTVEVGEDTFEAKAIVAEGAERDRLFDAQAELIPGFRDYEAATSRVIPVVTLERLG